MMHSLVKILGYVSSWNSYWKLTDSGEKLVVEPDPLGPYALDFRPRLTDNHYRYFDEEGLPLWPRRDGRGFGYHVTTMTSYALAHWHLFLQYGDERHLRIVVAVAGRLAGAPRQGGALLLLDDIGGRVSAMSQGEGMSVLCRAWQATGEERFLQAASECLAPFLCPVSQGGVVGTVGPDRIPWFEECTALPPRHILNGMVYAVWGLGDLATCTGDHRARELFELGIKSLSAAVDGFDLGWWSRYWIPVHPAPEYIASMMYHNLHICQLLALSEQTGDRSFGRLAARFLNYAQRPALRFRAAAALLLAKAEGRANVF